MQIAIVTKDRSDEFESTLENLDESLYDKVLVIDGSEGNETQIISEEYGVEYHKQESRGMTAARNEALRYCEDEYIIFIDDDVRTSDNWFSEIKYELSKEDETVGATCKLEDEGLNLGGISNKLRELIFGGKEKFGEIDSKGVINGDFFYNERKEVDHMPGCNMAYHVPTLRKVEGFDEKIDVGNSYREDTIASYKVGREGKIIYTPEASVNHLAVDEEGDKKTWMFYNPYLTRYFLEEYDVVKGFRKNLENALITVIRHIYFGFRSLSNLKINYLLYLYGELMGMRDFTLKDRNPKEYI